MVNVELQTDKVDIRDVNGKLCLVCLNKLSKEAFRVQLNNDKCGYVCSNKCESAIYKILRTYLDNELQTAYV